MDTLELQYIQLQKEVLLLKSPMSYKNPMEEKSGYVNAITESFSSLNQISKTIGMETVNFNRWVIIILDYRTNNKKIARIMMKANEVFEDRMGEVNKRLLSWFEELKDIKHFK